MLKPINLRGYDFIGKEQPLYFKKGKDGVNRTNYFKGANLIFTNEKMFVFARRFSLTDESIDEVITVPTTTQSLTEPKSKKRFTNTP